jgi:hypothetical protein
MKKDITEQIQAAELRMEANMMHQQNEIAFLKLKRLGYSFADNASERLTPLQLVEELDKPVADRNWRLIARGLLALLAND